ncbi:hypothetical protein FOZ60_002552 [Perkinsus olseni]|uniref:Uncharacterized protein n=1 Tax=Perkinsus olseni TaxID=32597 RepID=A0A7J6NZZ1_PEROL|nr:hypothetical protein FOZ60_002552 [Perkinsus olseni]
MEFPSEFKTFAPTDARDRCPEEAPHRVALLRDINDRLTRQLAAHRLSSQGHLHRPHVRTMLSYLAGLDSHRFARAVKDTTLQPLIINMQGARSMSATSASAVEGMASLMKSKEAELRRLEQSLARLRAENAELLRRKHERDEATAVKRAAASLMREHTTLLDEWSGRIAEFLLNTVGSSEEGVVGHA